MKLKERKTCSSPASFAFDPASWIFFSLVGSSPSLGSPRKKNMLTLPQNKLAFRPFSAQNSCKYYFISPSLQQLRSKSCFRALWLRRYAPLLVTIFYFISCFAKKKELAQRYRLKGTSRDFLDYYSLVLRMEPQS
jgi:hypothetical protein